MSLAPLRGARTFNGWTRRARSRTVEQCDVAPKPIQGRDALLARLKMLAERASQPIGLEVAWVELKSHGGKTLFRVFIDREAGVGLEDCQQVSERLGIMLDVEDPIESSYTLEVSSPGLDRPLWNEKDYRRFTGRLARVKTREPLGGKRHFRGRLAGLEGGALVLENKRERMRIPILAIESARLEVELFSPREGRSSRRQS